MEIKDLNIDEIITTAENPNVMDEKKFNQLYKVIEKEGFDQPIKVWWNEEIKKYEVVKGNHRYQVIKILGNKTIPAVIGTYENRDEMLKDLVRDNIVKGKLDPIKFTQLFDKVSKDGSKDALKEVMGFTDEAEFTRVYKEVKDSLPEDLKKKLEKSKDQIKTIDDLSYVLNKMFAEYGDTLPIGFIVFNFGKETHFWVKMDKELKDRMTALTDKCKEENIDISIKLNEILKTNE